HYTACAKGGAQRLLGAGLADAAGNRDDPRGAAPARGDAQRGQTVKRVGDPQQLSVADLARDHRRDGAAGKGGLDVIVAVVIGTAEGDEEVAGRHGTAVDRHAGGLPVAGGSPAGRRGGLGGGPERGPGHWPMTSRATSTSSKGSVSVPTICPLSWPLPAITSTSPGP